VVPFLLLKNKKIKLLLIFLVVLLFSFSIVVAGVFLKKGDTNLKKEEKNFLYWGLKENFDVSALLFDQFKAEHSDVYISYDQKYYGDLSEYKDFITTRLKEKTIADVVLVHSTWVPEIINYLYPAPNISGEEVTSNFFPDAGNSCVAKNSVYCVPPIYDGLALIYNKKAFQKAEIIAPPKTWEEFKQYAVKLTKKDVKTNSIFFSGASMGLSQNVDFAPDILGLMLAQSDIRIPEDLNSKPASDALSFFVSFYRDLEVWDEKQESSMEAFINGKVAMIFAPSWALNVIKEKSPYLNFGVAPVPQVPILGSSGLTNTNWASYWVFVVPKSSRDPALSWEFIKFAVSEKQQLVQYKSQKEIRPFGQIYSRKQLRSEISKEDLLKPFVDGIDTAKSFKIASFSGNKIQNTAILEAITSVSKGGSSDNALNSAKSVIEEAGKKK